MLVKGDKPSLRNVDRILLVQLGDIGDVVFTTPGIRALKETYPEKEVHLLLRCYASGLMKDFPWADGIISVEKGKKGILERIACQGGFINQLRKRRFQAAIDLRTGTRGAILSFLSGAELRVGRYVHDGRLWRDRLFTHLIDPGYELDQYCALHSLNILEPFELRVKDVNPFLYVTNEAEERAKEILISEGIPEDLPVIALNPCSRWSYKEWTDSSYAELIDNIYAEFEVNIIITGDSQTKPRAECIIERSGKQAWNLAGKTTISELPGILKSCSLLIGIDSAPVHIAAAVGVPTITIFGPSAPVNWAPRGENHDVVQKDLQCVPCRRKGCNNTGTSRCLEELKVAEVFPVVEARLRKILPGL